jgi:hypothetical protein
MFGLSQHSLGLSLPLEPLRALASLLLALASLLLFSTGLRSRPSRALRCFFVSRMTGGMLVESDELDDSDDGGGIVA